MAMRDNLSRKESVQVDEQVYSKPQPYIQSTPASKPKQREKLWTFGQKVTVSVLSVCVTGLCVVAVSVSNQLQSTNRDVQDIASQTAQIQEQNNNLEQSVSELSRYDRIYEIAESFGLELNDQKVKNVSK